jgi:hypothetical protein
MRLLQCFLRCGAKQQVRGGTSVQEVWPARLMYANVIQFHALDLIFTSITFLLHHMHYVSAVCALLYYQGPHVP